MADGTLSAPPVPQGTSDACAVAVVSADAERRNRLARIAREGNLRIAAEASTVDDLGRSAPVIALDAAATPDGDATVADMLEALRRLQARLGPTNPIVIFRTLRTGQLRKLLDGGVVGVLLDAELERALTATVRAAWRGQLVVPRTLRRGVSQPELSARQKEILCLVVLGLSNKEIAGRLGLAEATVSRYVSAAFGKLEVQSRADAAALLLEGDEGGALIELSTARRPSGVT